MHFFVLQSVMSGSLKGISATPFLQWAQRILVATNPGLGFHETPAFTAALGFGDKSGATFTGVVPLLPNLLAYPPMESGLPSRLNEPFRHRSGGGPDLLDGDTSASNLAKLVVPDLGPGRARSRGIHARRFEFLPEIHC